jgi:hypothetical protein
LAVVTLADLAAEWAEALAVVTLADLASEWAEALVAMPEAATWVAVRPAAFVA